MAIRMTCSKESCRKLLKASDGLVGRKIRCPSCGTVMVVPGQPLITCASKENDRLETPIPGGEESKGQPSFEAAILVPIGLGAVILLLGGVWWLRGSGGESGKVVPPPVSSSGPAVKPAEVASASVTDADAKESGHARQTDVHAGAERSEPTPPDASPPTPTIVAARELPRPLVKTNGRPVLSDLKILSTRTSPVTIKFSVRITRDRAPISFEKKSGLWFFFGEPSTVKPRAFLQEQVSGIRPSVEDNNNVRILGNAAGPGFVAASCNQLRKAKDQADSWTGSIVLNELNLRGDTVVLDSAFGSQTFEVTEMPVSWLVWDDDYQVSDELKAVVDLTAGKLVKVESGGPNSVAQSALSTDPNKTASTVRKAGIDPSQPALGSDAQVAKVQPPPTDERVGRKQSEDLRIRKFQITAVVKQPPKLTFTVEIEPAGSALKETLVCLGEPPPGSLKRLLELGVEGLLNLGGPGFAIYPVGLTRVGGGRTWTGTVEFKEAKLLKPTLPVTLMVSDHSGRTSNAITIETDFEAAEIPQTR